MSYPLSQYPAVPDNPARHRTQPSPEFKRQVIKVFLLCIFFLITYAAVVLAAIGLAVLTVVLAAGLAAAVPNFITLMLALGALGLAVMIIIFVVNSLIIKLASGWEGAVEIAEEDEPLLFEFIKRVTQEVGTPFPKKIFFVDGFNAAVAYDSVFLSMFFPQRKNLYVGLALVNSLTISEFKAVLGHEFGHFSQKSMRLGAYVYHFNLIVHKMLFDNEQYQNALEKWGHSTWYFTIFKQFAQLIIQGMRWIMRKVYLLLNKEHMNLSRQMEFHADAVAASVSGSKSNITAQYRSDFASECYTELLSFYGTLVKQNRVAENVYAHHYKMMQLYAAKYEIPMCNGLPMIDANSFNQLGKRRIVIKDQWASHPTTEERIFLFSEMNIHADAVENSAWELFATPTSIQQLFTNKLYNDVQFESDPIPIDINEFELKYLEHLGSSSLQPEFKGYYNKRNIHSFDLNNVENTTVTHLSGELFPDNITRLPVMVANLENDIAVLSSLSEENTGIRSFDFDGEKFEVHQAEIVKTKLNKELEEAKSFIDAYDKAVYYHTQNMCDSVAESSLLKQAYFDMFAQIERSELDFKLYNEMCEVINPVYTRMQHEDIKIQVICIIRKEQELKERLQEFLNNNNIIQEASLKEHLTTVKQLVDSNHIYYSSQQYLNNELQLLTDALNSFLTIVIDYTFLLKKNALNIQSRILSRERAEPSVVLPVA